MKYNAVIMLKEILKHVDQYLGDDVQDGIFTQSTSGDKIRLLGYIEHYR